MQQDLRQDERLREETVRSRFQRPHHLRRIGAQDEDRDPLLSFGVPQAFEHLEPVHQRHLEIEKDQVVAIQAVKRAHLERVRRGGDRDVAPAPKRVLEQSKIGLLVVDDQDPCAGYVS